MGVLMAGGIFSGANPTYTARELAHQIRDSGATFLLCKRGDPLKTGCEAGGMAGLDRGNIYIFDDGVYDSLDQPFERGCRYWGSLFASEAEGEKFVWDELDTHEKANRTLALNYSSGTTGLPKGVEITHYNYVANVTQYNFMVNLDPVARARQPLERWLCFLPMYHAMAQMIFIGCAQLRQTPVYMMERFDFIAMLKNVEKFKITDLILVPPVMVAMAKSPETRKYDLSSVWRVGSGAAPLSREVSEEVEALWPKGTINVKQGWGMTEYVNSLRCHRTIRANLYNTEQPAQP
jgi:4-coumarate--CoA ligase